MNSAFKQTCFETGFSEQVFKNALEEMAKGSQIDQFKV